MLAAADDLLATCRAAMDGQQIHQALTAIWAVIADANRYFAAAEPWALKKTDPARMSTVLYVTAEVVRIVAILVQPVMPDAGAKLLDLLGVPEDARSFAAARSRQAAGGRNRHCRRRRRCSRASSKPHRSRPSESSRTDARRQPLPSRLPRL